jgi:hypothetical protein
MSAGAFTLSQFRSILRTLVAKCGRASLSALAEWRQVNQGRDEAQ